MSKEERKPQEAENGLKKEAKKTDVNEVTDYVASELGDKCEVVEMDPRRPVCIVGEGVNKLYNSGVFRVLIIKKQE